MSHTPYDAISQGPVQVQMDHYGGQTQRIMPPVEPWCNSRRTKVIIAIVILSLIYIIAVIVYATAMAKLSNELIEETRWRLDH